MRGGFFNKLPYGFRSLLTPPDDFKSSVEMLDEGCATFHPIAIVQIVYSIYNAVVGCVDVTADHTLAAPCVGLADDSFLKS